MRYKYIIMGFYNYYHIVDREWDIDTIKYLLTYSALHTLAAKHRMSLTKTMKKYGKKVSVTENNKTIDLDYIKIDKKKEQVEPVNNIVNLTKQTLRTIHIMEQNCKICGSSERIQVHHIKHLKDLNPKLSAVDVLMAKIRRKQIPVCYNCHQNIHKGKYDGNKL